MKNHSHQADGRTVAQVLLRPFQWWARNPWVAFWGSMALFPFLLILMVVLSPDANGYGMWFINGGLGTTSLVAFVSNVWGLISAVLDLRRPTGARVLKVLVIAIPLLLAAIAVPNLLNAARKGKIGRAVMDTKIAVTQAIEYGKAKGRYPTSLQVLREAGYPSLSDKDLWGQAYVLAPILTRGGTPTAGEDVYVYSKGVQGTGTYPRPFTPETGEGGSIGYSSIYGEWRGR
jgi:type II secretory pathway pseudopilin PulG